MDWVLAMLIGLLYGSGLFLMMRRTLVQLVIGLGLLSHGANLLIFIAGGYGRGAAPILEGGKKTFAAVPADPLPQALILTAIVISFAVTAFALTLFLRTVKSTGTDDVDAMLEDNA
ncbi:MAG TPA: Na+/H+ antiporter subunit C [Verrucomicrobia bacterium]|nr:Na+/H+ antiporter subunit C [Kiritimatiellaceae bacterium]HBO88044.1 Na+/H+ antiporter subunit C [Verrucomicrobiota bacterium]|tara:strand:- start:599 stop:946 length:348 start_codon:yes stop_codon:yes gene_type:complete